MAEEQVPAEEATQEPAPVTTQEATFSKEQLVKSEKYKQYRDILASQLDDAASYTASQVDKLIEAFLKGEVE